MKTQGKRRGRPPKIDRAAIAVAVTEVGLDELTMKRVADQLGMSIAGLYRYVNGRDELLELAREQALARLRTPEERGQHWATWLREWSHYLYQAILDNRELFVHVSPTTMVGYEHVLDLVATAVQVLEEKGLGTKAAFTAYEAVSALAMGSALGDPPQQLDEVEMQAWTSWSHPYFSQRNPETVAVLRRLSDDGVLPRGDEQFEECLTTVLIGVAVRAGMPLDFEVTGTLRQTGT
jgi:AcrR family transcriptional regulator